MIAAHIATPLRTRRAARAAALLVSMVAGVVFAELSDGFGVVNDDGSIKIEAEAMEIWNGCIEIKNEVCGKICDPFGTDHEKGSNCWDNEHKDYCSPPSSGLMGVGMCGCFSFVDFMPVPKATSFSVRYSKAKAGFNWNIFINGEPWRTNITFPAPTQDDSGKYVWEWQDTLFQNVPLDQNENFIRIQRAGTGIPTIDYITVHRDGVGNRTTPAPVGTPRIAQLDVCGTTITYSLCTRRRIILDIIDAVGRIVQELDNGIRDAGNHTLSLHTHTGRGLLFVRLRSGDMLVTNRLVMVE